MLHIGAHIPSLTKGYSIKLAPLLYGCYFVCRGTYSKTHQGVQLPSRMGSVAEAVDLAGGLHTPRLTKGSRYRVAWDLQLKQ